MYEFCMQLKIHCNYSHVSLVWLKNIKFTGEAFNCIYFMIFFFYILSILLNLLKFNRTHFYSPIFCQKQLRPYLLISLSVIITDISLMSLVSYNINKMMHFNFIELGHLQIKQVSNLEPDSYHPIAFLPGGSGTFESILGHSLLSRSRSSTWYL